MGLRVVTAKTLIAEAAIGNAPTDEKPDEYRDKIIKYIPADVVAAWITIKSIFPDVTNTWGVVLVVVFLVLAGWLTMRSTTEPNKSPAYTQIVLSMLSFVFWTITLGEPFTQLLRSIFPNYDLRAGIVALVIWTVIVPNVDPGVWDTRIEGGLKKLRLVQ